MVYQFFKCLAYKVLSKNCRLKLTLRCQSWQIEKILSGSKDSCGSHMTILWIFFFNNTLGFKTIHHVFFYFFLNFSLCLNWLALNQTQTHFYKSNFNKLSQKKLPKRGCSWSSRYDEDNGQSYRFRVLALDHWNCETVW